MRSTLSISRPARAAAVVTAALALAACGGDDPTLSGSGAGGQPGSTAQSGAVAGIDRERNDQDIAFITDMKPHHEGALEMARLGESRAADPKVKDLARRIVAAQDPEIQTMQKMATAWGVDLNAAAGGPHGGMNMGGGMGKGEDVAALEPLSGPAFDKEFLTRMTAHHQSAVEMANKELSAGLNKQAKQMAQDIVTSQTAEINEMKTLLAAL